MNISDKLNEYRMNDDNNRHGGGGGGFIKKPGKGWLHSDTSIQEGISYNVKVRENKKHLLSMQKK